MLKKPIQWSGFLFQLRKETLEYKIQKEEVAYLSANTWDVSAGGNYGFNPVWVNRKNSIFDKLDYVPKYQVENLGKLLDII